MGGLRDLFAKDLGCRLLVDGAGARNARRAAHKLAMDHNELHF